MFQFSINSWNILKHTVTHYFCSIGLHLLVIYGLCYVAKFVLFLFSLMFAQTKVRWKSELQFMMSLFFQFVLKRYNLCTVLTVTLFLLEWSFYSPIFKILFSFFSFFSVQLPSLEKCMRTMFFIDPILRVLVFHHCKTKWK